MSDRTLVVQVLAAKMRESFCKGQFIDAQNIEAFLRSLEGMTDEKYSELVAEAEEGSESLTP